MKLLVDNYRFRSLGGLQLQRELKQSIIETVAEGDEVLLTQAHGPEMEPFLAQMNPPFDPEEKGPFNYLIWFYQRLPRIARTNDVDVIYMMSGIVTRRLQSDFGIVTTVNNMVPFDPDILELYRGSFRQKMRYMLLRRSFLRNIRMADAVVMHSHSGLEMISRFAGDFRLKTQVALTGVPGDMAISPDGSYHHPYDKRPYLFYLSALRPYKNHIRLLEAYAKVVRDVPTAPELILAGIADDARYKTKVLANIEAQGLRGRVRYLGPMNRSEIPAWFHHAEIALFPSMCETNSVIIAEMMAAGAVLACASIPSIVEVAKSASAFYDPHSVEEMTKVILGLLKDKGARHRLRAEARQRVQELQWADCGRAIWKSAHQALDLTRKRNQS